MIPAPAPLFPLPLVLFPGQMRTLRIFEPRYRALLDHCLALEQPFGILLSRPATRAQPEPLPHRVGTLAHITEVQRLSDDTFALRVYGRERFRVDSFLLDKPYLQGRIQLLSMLAAESAEAHALHPQMMHRLRAYVEALSQASGLQFGIVAYPPEPLELAFLTALALQINNEEKQALLAATHLPTLMRRELQLLHSELDLMAWIMATLPEASARSFGPSGALHPN
ncbi:MAG: LON peptidase substrate-binding domain-containing protein [Caldilineales bacterium]|nr:LON peptidase substrate-binding domain-containing protein [Caldilineales bacterium]